MTQMIMRALLSTILKLNPLRQVIILGKANMSTSDTKNAIKGTRARKERLIWVDLEVSTHNVRLDRHDFIVLYPLCSNF